MSMMRKEFSVAVEEILSTNPKSVFITADLGFNALEPIQKTAKERFINAGVAEQNMIGVAAGLAYKGFETFVYNIAPFAVLRSLEQIKIDICIHNLPVYIIGNGGGYGYGVMGVTHHAIEDIACISTLPNIRCWIPAFTEDLSYCIQQIYSLKKPAYLRLGLGDNYPKKIEISEINSILNTNSPKITIVVLGPVIQNVLKAVEDFSEIDVFTILTVPVFELSHDLLTSFSESRKIMVIEEHVERGGLGEHLLSLLAKNSIPFSRFVGLHAKGYPSGVYGDQAFHQKESGLDSESIREQIIELLAYND